jgi:hypothetical protein
VSLPRSLYAASASAWWCCPDCDSVRFCCPGCSEGFRIERPLEQPPALPFHLPIRCPDPECEALLLLTICGYRPNPTGDAPANRSPLSDPLPVAERPAPMTAPRAQQQAPMANEQERPPLFGPFFNGETQPAQPTPPKRTQAQAHAARYLRRRGYINTALELQERPRAPRPPRPRRQARTTTPAAAAAAATLADFRRTFPADYSPRPKRPAPPPKPAPCPADAERHRLSVWDARGWLPDGVAPSAIAAAHCRVFGMPAPRDPSKRTARAYSLRELGRALGDLGRAFEPEPLRKVWDRALQRVALPSTRALFAKQARLMEVRGAVGMSGALFVVVAVASERLESVKSRRRLLSDALADALGQPVALALREVQL